MAPKRLVRQRPLAERVKAYLDPLDFLLWLSEELDSSDWDQWQRDWATPIGVGANLVMLVARAKSGGGTPDIDDVFSDVGTGAGWLDWFAAFVVHFLSLCSFLNAAYTFYRKRRYRLFESAVDAPLRTPSARRVRVDSSPMSSSPLRFLSNILADNSAQARAHPDATRDVWELSVWDPTPLCLKMFCLFSPGHVLVYWLFLPTLPQDPRPSTTVVTAITLAALLSIQLSMLQRSFSQQSKDASLIHKEMLNEYDIKYVHPRTQPIMRDAGTQFSGSRHPSALGDGVDTYTPVTVVNKGFRTNPNPNYLGHVNPDALLSRHTPTRAAPNGMTSAFRTPTLPQDEPSPLARQSAMRQSRYRAGAGTGAGDGGSLGVYSHAQSPLKKSVSRTFAGGGARESEGGLSPEKRMRESSPLKQSSVPWGLDVTPGQSWAPDPRRQAGRF